MTEPEKNRLAEMLAIARQFTPADYDLLRRRLSELKAEEIELRQLEALIRVTMNSAAHVAP